MTDEALKQTLAKTVRVCSFCGENGYDGTVLFCTPAAAICENCVTILGKKLKQHYFPYKPLAPVRH